MALGTAVLAGGALVLYSGEGVLPAVSFLLALVLAALGVGVWAGAPGTREVSSRSRWTVAVVAFGLAAVFARVWNADPQIQAVGFGRALAVLFFLAEPAYAIGSLLAGLEGRMGDLRGTGGVAVPALLGVAAGVLGCALLLVPNLTPGSIFLGGVAVLALAGMWESGQPASERSRGGVMRERVVVITGVGTQGQVGWGVAEACLQRGAVVVISGRHEAVEGLARDLDPARAVGVRADLTVPQDAERLMQIVEERFGRLDVLVNAAGGLSVIKPLAATSAEEWRSEWERNATTAFLTTRAALPLLRRSRGSVINFASPVVATAVASLGAYGAAKSALVSFTRALALEERENGVRVNALAPGMIDTGQNRTAVERPDEVTWVTMRQVVEAVLFLASDASSGISGETIHVLGEQLA